MLAAMGITAFLCVFIGCYTPYLYHLLPYPEAAQAYHPYTSYHVSETLQILLFTALGFFVLVRLKKIEPHRGINLDLDWFYRMGGRAFLWLARKPVQSVDTGVGEVYRVGGLVPLMKSAGLVGVFDNRVIDGAVDGLASAVRGLGGRLRFAQRGALQENLTLVFAVAAILILAFLFSSVMQAPFPSLRSATLLNRASITAGRHDFPLPLPQRADLRAAARRRGRGPDPQRARAALVDARRAPRPSRCCRCGSGRASTPAPPASSSSSTPPGFPG